MSNYEIISLILSGVAVLISIIVGIWSYNNQKKSNTFAENQEKINQAQVELTIEQAINQSKARLMDLKLMDKRNRNYDSVLKAAKEEYLNTYESACSKYIDKKVDIKRFKKDYLICIKQIVDDNQFSDKFDKVSSPYKAILKVYDEWYNLEK